MPRSVKRKDSLMLFIACLLMTFVQAQQVSVMTYNIRYDDKKNTQDSWDNRKAGVIEILKKYNPDIFGTQEGQKHQLDDIQHTLTNYNYFGEGRDVDRMGEYCAIFYNHNHYSLLHHGTFWLSPTTDIPGKAWDAAYPRIVTYGLFRQKESQETFYVFNTHFDHVGIVAKTESTDLILNKIQEINSTNLPVILMGDFNLEPESLSMIKLDILLNDACEGFDCEYEGTFNNFLHTKLADRRIDYIFSSGNLAAMQAMSIADKVNQRYPSDHLPVFANYRFNAFENKVAPVKKTINLDWKFYRGDLENGLLSDGSSANWEVVNIPHTWNDQDVLDETPGYYRGKAWYKKSIPFTNIDSRYILHFEGVNQVATTYINGSKAGHHIGGYNSFSVDITDFLIAHTDNEVSICVDNAHNAHIIPLEADFNFYGGIYRDVWLEKVDAIHFDRTYGGANGVYIDATIKNEVPKIAIRANIVNSNNSSKNLIVHHILKDEQGHYIIDEKSPVILNSDNRSVEHFFQNNIERVHRWSIERPYQYKLISTIEDQQGTCYDSVVNSIGFRTFEFNSKGFFLNDQPVKLIGSNRHQDYKDLGNALSNKQHIDDLLMLKEMGINFLRISHYPQDPVVLEMCNRLGFVATEEIPFVNEATASEEFRKNTIQMLREMIRRDYNHAAIVAWATSNELSLRLPKLTKNMTTEQANDYIAFLANLLKELDDEISREDPERYSYTVHCCGKEKNKAMGLHAADIIGYNKYFGWYEGKTGDIGKFMEDFMDLEPDKAFILSEYGAGADPRIHTLTPKRFDFSIEYQTDFHKIHLEAILNNDLLAGANIWNFADFMAEHRRDAVPHVNNKGIVDLERKPKDAFYFYRAALNPKPYLIIPSKLWTLRGGIEEENGSSSQPIEVYGNIEEAELFLNDISLGKKALNFFSAEWDVPFLKGKNRLEVKGLSQDLSLNDELIVDFQMLSKDMINDSFHHLSINVGSHFYFLDQHKLWFPDRLYQPGSYGHVDGKNFLRDFKELVGSDRDILGTTRDPIYQTQQYGLSEYKIDVPNGTYTIIFHFSEILDDHLLKKWSSQNQLGEISERIFDVYINGEMVLTNVNSKKDNKPFYAIEKSVNIACSDDEGISITFSDVDRSFLSGIEILKMN